MKGMQLTRGGANLLARALCGEELRFSRCALGSGELPAEESIFDLTSLKAEEMTLPIQSIEKIGDGTVRIVAHASNAEVYQSFAAREHAVFAINPTTGEEILYSYCNVGNEYSFIPSNLGPVAKDLRFSYITVIRDAENVTATLDLSFAYTSTDDFNSHINSKFPHPNTPNHFDDVASADFIWASNFDNHLHKISVNNLKNLLSDDIVSQNTAPITDAKSELGLEANLLIVEDFSGESVTDNFKVKVTSCAKDGNLLGLESVTNLITGAYYTISDGVNAEEVQIKSVRKNISGLHAVLAKPLTYSYNDAYLYRTTPALCDSRVVMFESQGFSGVNANIARTLQLNFDNAQISGDGIIDDNFFTLACL